MEMIIRFTSGRRVEALVLSASSDRMRILLRRSGDTLEVRRSGSWWCLENGHRFEIEGVLHTPETQFPHFDSEEVREPAFWQSEVPAASAARGHCSTM